MKQVLLFSYLIFSASFLAMSQDSLLDELEEGTEEELFNYPAFKAMKIGNLQSTKVADKGDLYMYVSHRFGTLKDGMETFFGLDNANTKIQFVYGLLPGLQIGISRESIRKTYAGSAKLRLIEQSKSFPLNVVGYGTVNINSELKEDRYPNLRFEDRFSYASQLLISSRITNRLSLELAPSFVYQNLVLEKFQQHEQFALGTGGRMKLSKRISFNVDYVYNFSRAEESIYNNPLTMGIDIETGGHVFQLLFSNAQSTNEPGFISNAEGDWSEGDVFFGFNIVRVF